MTPRPGTAAKPAPTGAAARPPWPYPRWIAHRGAGTLAPENTLAAFRLGTAHGCRMFECDVKLSADGVPFLLHDATLERTTNGHGIGARLPWGALARLDAGSWHSSAYAGEPPPSLEAIAHHCLANGLFLNIEIKPTPGAEEETGRVVARHAARLWRGAAIAPPLLTSFHPEALAAARAAAPRLPRGLLLQALRDDWPDLVRRLGCAALVCHHALWDAALARHARGQGLRALGYTVNDADTAGRLRALGLEGLITDRLDLMRPSSA